MKLLPTLWNERPRVAQAMERFGGGFASALGIALGRADDDNLIKIYNTWPDLWEQYLQMTQKL